MNYSLAAEWAGGPGTSQRGYAAKTGEAPDQARAEGPTTPPARVGRAPNVVERVRSALIRQHALACCLVVEQVYTCAPPPHMWSDMCLGMPRRPSCASGPECHRLLLLLARCTADALLQHSDKIVRSLENQCTGTPVLSEAALWACWRSGGHSSPCNALQTWFPTGRLCGAVCLLVHPQSAPWPHLRCVF